MGSGGSGRRRPLLSRLRDACGASISASNASSCSLILAMETKHSTVLMCCSALVLWCRARVLLCWVRSAMHDIPAAGLARQQLPKACSCFHRRKIENLSDRLSNVSERFPCAEIDARRDRCPGDKQRHMLARVIRGRRCGIVAMIGGDDEKVGFAQARQYLRQARIEAFQVRGVALEIVAMAVLGI